MNLNIFKIKTKLQMRVEEYVAHKAKTSPFIAEDQRQILTAFIKTLDCRSVADITPEHINAYHSKIKSETTPFTTIKVMQAVRAFLRFHRHFTEIKPDRVTNKGVDLQTVAESAIIPPMIRKRKVGRPPNVAFIKEVKELVDKRGLSIRAVARAKLLNPGNVYRAYRYDLSKVA